MNTDINSPDFNKKLPFEVPKGYFDTLPQRIEQRCTSMPEAEHTPWIVAFRSQLAFVAGFAALAILASLGYFFSQQFSTKQAIPHQTDYVEIVSRNTIDDDYNYENYKAIETRRHQIDSLNEFTNGMFLRYYSPKNKFSTISEERKDFDIQH